MPGSLQEGPEMWTRLTKRTNDPKLAWLEKELLQRGIPSRRNGSSFHAPILEVPEDKHDLAWAFLGENLPDGRLIDDVDDDDDDDPVFR